MKKINKILALVLAVTVAFASTACSKSGGKDSSPVQEIAEDYAGYLHEKFGVSEDDINEYDPSGFPNSRAFEGEYYICVDGDMPDMECCIYDDADAAREYFVSLYDGFNEEFDEERFDGDYQIDLQDDSGYIVVNGTNIGTRIFGDMYVSGIALYAGIYYDGDTILFIRPRNQVTDEEIENIIATMELPMANGENT